jgi:hypothetical protein
MARQLYYRDSYGTVHRDRQAGGGGVTIVVYGRTEIRLERVPDKDEARGSSRRAPGSGPASSTRPSGWAFKNHRLRTGCFRKAGGTRPLSISGQHEPPF